MSAGAGSERALVGNWVGAGWKLGGRWFENVGVLGLGLRGPKIKLRVGELARFGRTWIFFGVVGSPLIWHMGFCVEGSN